MELIELRQTSATIQCPSCPMHVPDGLNVCQCGVWLRPKQSTMDRIRATLAALKTPCYRTTGTLSRGRKSGHNQWQIGHQKAMDARRGVLKRGKYTSTPLLWTDGRTTKHTERLNWYTVGLTSGPSTSTTFPRLTSVMEHLTDSDYDMKAHST